LIWSGALLFNRSNVFDFRKTRYRGSDALSLIVGDASPVSIAMTSGVGIILNSSYEIVKTVFAINGQEHMHIDMHEFNLIDDGKTALVITVRSAFPGESALEENANATVRDNGFQEIETETNKLIFEWWAFDYVPASDTHSIPPEDA
jgi:hypothetical protein